MNEFLCNRLNDVPDEIRKAVAGVIDGIPKKFDLPLSAFAFNRIYDEDRKTIGVDVFFNNQSCSGELSFENDVDVTICARGFFKTVKIAHFYWKEYMTSECFLQNFNN